MSDWEMDIWDMPGMQGISREKDETEETERMERFGEEFGETEDADAEGTEGAEEETDSLTYIESLLDERIVRAIREMGFDKLTPIQEMAIPYLLDGEDIIGQAQTGTGKTAAFAIPALQKIDPESKKLQTIVLCPTRELAMQAAEEIRKIAKYMHGIKVLAVYGGQDIGRQISGLKGVQIIVGTPGRVMDHMRRHTLKLDDVNMVVLDEADEMLDMGFREDMELILGEIPGEHQTALFSATMPQPILDITNQFQKDARLVKVAAKELTIPLVAQRFYKVKPQDKDAACVRLLEYYQPKLCLIFCNTKVKVDELAEVIGKAGFQVEGLHGDMSQHLRDVAMRRFRNGNANILIATDVAARGIDVDNVEVVINYDLPQDIEYYVHRIGRTGRAGKTGRSFTFASARELYRIRQIERFCHTTIEEKKLPGASKVLKAKADKYLNRAWELHEHEDMELMKSYLQRKMAAEECDILDLAAAMLKYQIGDKGAEIQVDDSESRKGRRSEERGGRRRGRGEGRDGRRDERESRRRGEREDDRRRRRDRKRDQDGVYEEEGRRSFQGDGFEEERGSRRDSERRGERESRRDRDFREDRESRRDSERRDGRESRRDRDFREDRESRRDSERRDGRESRRDRDFREDRESRRGSDRRDGRESRRDSERRGERESRGRDSRESRRDRDKKRSSGVWDVRMDGSDRGLAFSFPKKKRK